MGIKEYVKELEAEVLRLTSENLRLKIELKVARGTADAVGSSCCRINPKLGPEGKHTIISEDNPCRSITFSELERVVMHESEGCQCVNPKNYKTTTGGD